MPQSTDHSTDHATVDDLAMWLRRDYEAPLGELAEHYPSEQRSLELDWTDLHRYDPDLADDYLNHPEQIGEYLEESLRCVDLPVGITLGNAHVRVRNIPDARTYYPGGFSPTDYPSQYLAVRGEVSKATDAYANMEEAAFECQRCGTLTDVPQSGGDFQEPHECQGCERQGPFQINFDQSAFVDAQDLLVQTPPEVASGAGQSIEVHVEDDLADIATVGDRVTVSGIVHLEQQTKGTQKTTKFDPYLEGRHIEVEETDHTEIEVISSERSRIEALADGVEGNPLAVAAQSYLPEIYGYGTIKQALVLAIVGGASDTDGIRGEFHVLVLGDPGTGKSVLIEGIDDLAVRSVATSAVDTTASGLTTTATRDDFGGDEWSLDAGAFVKAHEGVLYIDELDDMDPADRKSMLDPMSKQQIHVSKAGINATLSTQAAVIAAANPEYGRFDQYESLAEQFVFDGNLLSRFDLIFTVRDEPDPDEDADVGDHMTRARDAKKRQQAGEDLTDDQRDAIEGPVDEGILRKWLALAKQQPDPVYESEAVREALTDKFVTLRGIHGYDDNAAVPVTYRKLPAVERIAEAHAKLEFSPVITERHAEAAMQLVGDSMQDYAKNEDGELDADIQEVGESTSQRERRKTLANVIRDLQSDCDNGVPRDAVIETAQEEWGLAGVGVDRLHDDMDVMLRDGEAVEPQTDHIRYIGRR